MCNELTYKVIVVTDATYWTERVEATRARPLRYVLCFGTGRARSFPLILVDVIPREVVEILATKSGWTAKSTLSLRSTDPTCVSLLARLG